MILVYETAGVLRTIEFDATIREVHLGTAVPAEHPVQDEPDRTDDVKPEKVRLSAECIVTNTPVADVIGDVAGVWQPMTLETINREQVKGPEVSGGPGPQMPINVPFVQLPGTPVEVKPAVYRDNAVSVSGAVLQFPTSFDRVVSVYEELDQLRRKRSRFQVVSSLKTYDQMVITSISAPRTAAASVRFSLELTEVFVSEASQLVDVPVPLEKRAQKTRAQGAQATYELPEQQESATRQVLGSLYGAQP
jgi:hypothetical protein